MDNQAILTKAINLAIDGGWRGDLLGKLEVIDHGQDLLEIRNESGEEWSTEEIIFNKKFAKALWGKGEPDFWNLRGVSSGRKGNGSAKVLEETAGERFIPEWQYHLQQMVIAEDPIKYLERNI